MGDQISTVMVVGAGASAEFALPVGGELVERISISAKSIDADKFGRQHNGDALLFDAAQKIAADLPGCNFVHEMKQLASGVSLMPSIDNYLHAHSDNTARFRMGKLLIAHTLLNAERDSSLFFNPSNMFDRFDFSRIDKTWLHALFRALTTVGKLEEFRERLNAILFVSFNYDRIVHRFFFLALQSAFDLSEAEAEKICKENLHIIYPYGFLGELTPLNQGSGFGRADRSEFLLSAANEIKIFTEGGDNHTRQFARYHICEAETIFFMGFSFLPLNMNYLSPATKSSLRVFGTVRGMSSFNLEIAKGSIAAWIDAGQISTKLFSLVNTDCGKLISDHSGYFSFDKK